MEVFLIKAAQLLLCFAILIILHEGGHFFFAKLFGVRVEKFCIFFDPWKSWKLFRFKGTDYHIGWIPLGGYVSIAGMVDETTKADELSEKVEDWEFRGKPAWQRLLIMLGGVGVNFVLALFIYAMILFAWGDSYVQMRDIKQGFVFSEQAHELGFRDGDIPLSADDVQFERFNPGDCMRAISQAKTVEVLRGGKPYQINLSGDLNLLDMIQSKPVFLSPVQPSMVDSVEKGSPAQIAGMLPGDTIYAFRGVELSTWNTFELEVARIKDELSVCTTHADSLKVLTVPVGFAHADGTRQVKTITLNADVRMGVLRANPFKDYKVTTREYGLLESFPAGISHGWNVLCAYVSDLKYVFTKQGAESIGSFGAIGNLFPSSWDWMRFWELTAFISLMLAFMNLLPIPALDGGHAFFLLVEVITRRKPSDKFIERAGTVGMYLLLALMAYAIFNDFRHFLF